MNDELKLICRGTKIKKQTSYRRIPKGSALKLNASISMMYRRHDVNWSVTFVYVTCVYIWILLQFLDICIHTPYQVYFISFFWIYKWIQHIVVCSDGLFLIILHHWNNTIVLIATLSVLRNYNGRWHENPIKLVMVETLSFSQVYEVD